VADNRCQAFTMTIWTKLKSKMKRDVLINLNLRIVP